MDKIQNFCEKPGNKWSMGKYLRKLKNLRKKSDHYQILTNPSQSAWLKFYEENGLILNKITFARFFLKNGLSYDGMISTESIGPNEILIRVPKELTVSTRDAYLSDLKAIYEENPESFWNYDEIDEDLVFIVFILHELSKGTKSKFHHLISTLPKGQDVLCFWSLEDIDMFEDQGLTRKSVDRLNRIKNEFSFLKETINKYPTLIDPEIFNFTNFSWIYCLLLNRSFGSTSFSYVHMIPMAENFNHECTDTTFNKKESETTEQPNSHCNIEDIENLLTSEGESEEKLTDYEDDFFEVELEKKVDFIENEQKNKSAFIEDEILKWIMTENFEIFEVFSLVYVQKLINFLEKISKNCDYNIDEIHYKMKEIETQNKVFKNSLENLFQNFCKILNFKEHCKSLKWVSYDGDDDTAPKIPKDAFKKPFPEENYKFVDFVTGPNEFYEKDSQIYYCYGRKSNKSLAFCYGMCIEYNKYGSVFLKLDYRKYVEFNQIIMKKIVKNEKLPKFKKFKLKYTKFNVEMLCFFKLLRFEQEKHQILSVFQSNDLDLELQAIDEIIKFLEESYASKYSVKDNEKIIEDKSTGYHQYCAAVYRLEKQRIIKLQRDLMEIYREILFRIKSGLPLIESIKRVDFLENEDEYHRNRYLLHGFLKTINFSK